MYTLLFSLLDASFLLKLWCLNFNIFLDCWEVWYLRYANHPFHVSVIHILKFHYLENSTSIFGKSHARQLCSSIYDFTIVLYPNRYGVVVFVGLMFATISCYMGEFVTYRCITKCHMGTCGLPDIYTLSPWACNPKSSDVYIRQTTLVHVTTI